MTDLAPYISMFLQKHLPRDRNVSRHTIASYAYTFELLLDFAADRLGIWPSEMAIEQITVELVLDFLNRLENERQNTVRTRNLRLAAIKSFFRYLEFKVPACLHLAQQVHAIPIKRFDQAVVDYLERDELQAVLDAPDPTTVSGIRDRAMLHLTYAAGLRVSELIGLKCKDLAPDTGWIHVMGKGRRDRKLPVRKETRSLLEVWLAVRPDRISDHLFLNARGRAMTRHGFAHRLAIHVAAAKEIVPSIAEKRVSPHVIRHSCAIHTLEVVRDPRKVSLWLGHASVQSTEIYLRAEPIQKLEMLDEMVPPHIRKGRFNNVPDHLIAMFRDLKRV